ncbi:MAG: YhdP family protein [Burkholderiaceae bacterium]
MSPLTSNLPAPSTPALPYRPSRLLHLASYAMAWTWGLILLAALFLVLVWGALHGLIVPRIGEWRPTIENRLTHLIGVPVRIGSITAESHTLVPSFELQDVRLLDSTGRDALVLKKITALLSPRSLMQLRFEQLVIDQPELDILRNAQGKIYVAGLDMNTQSAQDGASTAAADWFFSQREFVIRSGTVRWTDELRGAPPLALNQVDFVVRNPGRRHLFRLDATPAVGWGERFSVVGQMLSPLISRHPGQWQEWDGELYADFSRIDVKQLKGYADLGIEITRGSGALRAWATLEKGQIAAATADVKLNQVDVRLAKDLQPIAIQAVSGRLTGQAVSGGLRVSTEDLAFRTQDGIQWPGGNLTFMQTAPENLAQAVGELGADRLDVTALAQIADRLPLGTTTHNLIHSLAPKGLITTIKASWQGPLNAPSKYEAQGRVQDLSVAAVYANTALHGAAAAQNRPGVRGATVDFKLNQLGGEAKLLISKGAVELPGAFEEPVVLFDRLSTDAKWAINGEKIDLLLNRIQFSNADTEGEVQAHWRTADPGKSNAKSRFPGVLDLQGSLSRGEGTKVHRYLPLSISKSARTYVHNAVLQGRINSGRFKIKGDLFDMPFANPQLGEFRIAAQVADAHFAYVPKSAQSEGSLPWPAITQINGELVFDRTSLTVNASSGRVGSNNSLQILQADARIPDLSVTPTVVVRAEVRGSARDVLATVNASPLLEITNKSLLKLTATGNADVSLQLNLPLFNLERSKVQGSVTLADSDVQVTPDTPLLARSKGVITFNESGFAVKDAQVRMLGGEARLEGGTRVGAGPNDAGLVFRAQGTVSAEGLRQAKGLGFASRLGQNASGTAAYVATLGFRRDVPELSISSNLQGMALNFPAPLGKPAEATLPLRYENSLVRESLAAGQKMQDQVLVDLGPVANIVFVRDVSGAEPRVLRGGIGVGLLPGEVAPVNEGSVVANINFAQVDLDAWQKVVSNLSGASFSPATPAVPTRAQSSAAAPSGYLPNIIAVRAKELTLEGHTLHNVVVGGSREGLTWRANLDARELNGYVEYRQPSGANPGRVYARLARLTIAPTEARELESVLAEQPAAIPALDIVVDDFDLRGKKFGRVEVEAINRGLFSTREDTVREWRLNKFNVIMPEAQLTATGNWAALGASALRTGPMQRRTVLNFKLDIADSGLLLKRLGMDKVINKGKGKLEGQMAWTGSPLALDYPSMGGNINLNIEAGQFLKADPGIAKLLGVLSLQTLPRRLALDFRDVFSDGFSFDFIRGDAKIDQGIAFTNNLQMKGINAAVLMEGNADIAKETQDLRVVVVPEINAGTASLIAAVINPAVGLGTFLAQLILRRPFIEAATQEFHIEGSWVDPKVTKTPRKVTAPPTQVSQ